MKVFITLLFWLSSLWVYCSPKPDLPVDSILAIAYKVLPTNSDSALYLLKSNKHRVFQSVEAAPLFSYYALLGQTYIEKNMTDSALKAYNNGLNLANRNNNLEQKANFTQLKASALTEQGNYAEALVNFEEALETASKHNYDFLSNLLINKARLHYLINDYQAAIVSLKQAMKIGVEENNDVGRSMIYNNLGIIFKQIENYDSSLYYHNQSLQISKMIKDSLGIAYSYNNMGVIFLVQYQYKKALNLFEQAYNANRSNPSLNLINNLSRVLIELKRYDEAKYLLEDVYSAYM